MMCGRPGWKPYYEPVAENPYLEDFYRDMERWAFASQVFFLTHRVRSHRALMEDSHAVVQDRSLYEDAEVFARNLYLQGQLNERDYGSYRDLYQVLVDFLPPPDLVVYLRAPVATLVGRIQQRGRVYERQITAEYLGRLNELYDDWINHFALCPVLTVPADELNYVIHPGHLNLVAQKIQEKLTGKDLVIFAPEEVENSR